MGKRDTLEEARNETQTVSKSYIRIQKTRFPRATWTCDTCPDKKDCPGAYDKRSRDGECVVMDLPVGTQKKLF